MHSISHNHSMLISCYFVTLMCFEALFTFFPKHRRHISSTYSSSEEKCRCCNTFCGFGEMFQVQFRRATAYLHKVLRFGCSHTGLTESIWMPENQQHNREAVQVKRILFQLCTTSFMASFIQREAWQTFSSVFLYKKKKMQFSDEVFVDMLCK